MVIELFAEKLTYNGFLRFKFINLLTDFLSSNQSKSQFLQNNQSFLISQSVNIKTNKFL